MSQIYKNNSGGGSGSDLETLSDDLDVIVNPSSSHNIQLVGHVNNSTGKFPTTVSGTSLIDLNPMSSSRWIVDSLGFNGTHTTIAAAIADASSGDTIFILTGTYVENITLKAGVNLTAYNCDSQTPNVTLNGEADFSSAGTVSISGINFLPAGFGHSIQVSGIDDSILNLINCNFSTPASNPSIEINSTSPLATINMFSCTGDIGPIGIAVVATGTGATLNIFDSYFTNTGNNNTGISCASNLNLYSTYMFGNVDDGGSINSILTINNSIIDSSSSNSSSLNQTNISTVTANNTIFSSGTAQACVINGTANLVSCSFNSSNASAISGTGTLNFSYLTFTGTSSTVTVLTQNPFPVLPASGGSSVFFQAYLTSPQSISGGSTTDTIIFDTTIDNVGSAYDDTTGIFTAPGSGYYAFSTTVFFNNLDTLITNTQAILAYTGSVQSLRLVNQSSASATTGNVIFNASWSMPMTVGDTVKIQPFADGTGTYDIFGGNPTSAVFNTSSIFSGFKVA